MAAPLLGGERNAGHPPNEPTREARVVVRRVPLAMSIALEVVAELRAKECDNAVRLVGEMLDPRAPRRR